MFSNLTRRRAKLNHFKTLSSLSQHRFSSAIPVSFRDTFEIPKHGIDVKHTNTVLNSFLPIMLEKSDHFLGYQANEDIPPIDALSKVLQIHMNNAGDPFIDSYCKTHCKEIERAVLRYCAVLWNDDPRIDSDPEHEDNFWGYVLNMGSTEGNINALWNAREYLKTAVTADGSDKKPVVFFSHDTHYSVNKACDLLSLERIKIESDKYGRIIIDKLCESVEHIAKQSRPIIIVYNMGTTFKGAYDDCEIAISRISQIINRYNLHGKYWNHLDGALGGFIIPFLRRGILDEGIIQTETGEKNTTIPDFGFNLDVQSCNASFYKWFGAPYPTGVFMTQNKYLRKAKTPDYIGAPDTTFGGGRNAFSALYMWWRLCLTDYDHEIKSVSTCLKNAKYLEDELNNIDKEFGDAFSVNVQRAPYSLSVTFNSPSTQISNKYSIPQEKAEVIDPKNTDKKVKVSRSHIYSMKHVKQEIMDEFLTDFRYFVKDESSRQ